MDSPLRGLDNITLLPHLGGPTPDRRRDCGELALENLENYLKNKFEYTDIGETAMGDLRDELADAKDEQSKEDFEEVKKKIANMKAKLKGRPVLDRLYKGTIDIPAGGSENLKLELTEMGGN